MSILGFHDRVVPHSLLKDTGMQPTSLQRYSRYATPSIPCSRGIDFGIGKRVSKSRVAVKRALPAWTVRARGTSTLLLALAHLLLLHRRQYHLFLSVTFAALAPLPAPQPTPPPPRPASHRQSLVRSCVCVFVAARVYRCVSQYAHVCPDVCVSGIIKKDKASNREAGIIKRDASQRLQPERNRD
jgi:hypothetical protein